MSTDLIDTVLAHSATVQELTRDIATLRDMGHRLNSFLVAATRIDATIDELTATLAVHRRLLAEAIEDVRSMLYP